MQVHVDEAHPECEFCAERLFDSDALFEHMRSKHVLCYVCHTSTGAHRYFPSTAALRAHLVREHHACRHPDCELSCIAFATAAELKTHRALEHSKRMVAMDRSRTSTMQAAFTYPHQTTHVTPPRLQARRRRRREGRAPVPVPASRDDAAATAAAAEPSAAVPVERAEGQVGVLQQEGVVMYDDNEGTVQDVPVRVTPTITRAPWPAATAAAGVAAARRAEDAARPAAPAPRSSASTQAWPAVAGQRNTTPMPSFPSLSEAAGPDPAAAQVDPEQRPPPLVRKQISCPCGRSKRFVVVREGADAGTMECQAVCFAARRQQQLAEAFGRAVDSPPSFVSKRAVEWPVELLVVRPVSCYCHCLPGFCELDH